MAACDSSCLTCDEARGDCLTCPARKGLDTGSSPRRCKTCDDIKCIDCGADFRRCTLCAFGLNNYLAPNGTCQWCNNYMSRCAPQTACRPDGSCTACDDSEGYSMIDGGCVNTPDGCNATNVEPAGGACTVCNSGYVKLANGTCQACSEGCAVCTEAGECSTCFSEDWKYYTMVGGKCKACPKGCTDCTGDPKRCRRCALGQGGLDPATGKCAPQCDDANCYDCAENKGVCKACTQNYYLSSDGQCVPCKPNCDTFPCDTATNPNGCSWATGQPMYKTCDASGTCIKCNTKFGRIGNDCVACVVKDCERCDGDTSKCTECGYSFPEDKPSIKLYPGKGNTTCILCQQEACAECDGADGPCTACIPGWGAVDGKCVKCEVKGCGDCSGDASGCQRCELIGDNCEASFWFDPRTRSCVKIKAVLDC